MKTSMFCSLFLLAFASSVTAQAPTGKSAKPPALVFRARPAKHLFAVGEDIAFVLSIRNQSAEPIFVSRLTHDEFVDFNISGPGGTEVPWQGKGRIDSKSYSPSDFAVLRAGEEIRARRIISLKNGQGYVFRKPGQYSVVAEYLLGPLEYFAPFAGDAKVPGGTFGSVRVTFCIETCNAEPQK